MFCRTPQQNEKKSSFEFVLFKVNIWIRVDFG